MAEAAPASGGAPAAAPATAPAPAPSSSDPGRGRVSSFEQAMEAKNAAAERRQQPRAQEPQPQQPPSFAERADRLLGEPEPEAEIEAQPETLLDENGEPIEEPPEEVPQIAQSERELAAKMQEILASDMLPDEFLDKRVEWIDPNGNVKYQSIKELREGNMRLGDYQRGMNQIREREQQAAWRDGNVKQHFDRINDPEYFLQTYEDRGYGEVLVKVAEKIAERKQMDRQIAEAAGYRVMRQYGCDGNDARVIDAMRQTLGKLEQGRKLEAQNRQLQAERDMHAQMRQQMAQQQDHTARTQQLGNSLAQLMPMAFRAARIHDNPANREDLLRHLNAYVRGQPDWDGQVRNVHVMKAAQLLAEELEDRDARKRAQPAKPAAKKPLVSGKSSSRGSAQSVGPTRKRPSDMDTDPRFGFGS